MDFGMFMQFEHRDGLGQVNAFQADAFNEGFKLVDAAEEWGLDGAWLAELNPADRFHRPRLCPVSNVWCELRETRNHYSRRKGASGR